jgi:hypothetical protein
MWFRKIFNVSLHRNGTQSVHDLLVRSGLSSIHWPGIVGGVDYEQQVAGSEDELEFVADTLAPVIDQVTAVSDVPLAALYDRLEHAYPDSAFILIYRNPFEWLKSVRNHIGDRDLSVFEKAQYWRYLAGRPVSLRGVEDSELCLAYLSHCRDVMAFFLKRCNLVAVDLQDPEAGERICRFLGVPPIALQNLDFKRGDKVL